MADKKYSPFQTKLYELCNMASAGQLIYAAEVLCDNASRKLGRTNKDQREITDQVAETLSNLRETRTKEYLRNQDQGPAEIEYPIHSTSADAGKVA